MAEALSIEKNGRQLNMTQWHDRFCSAASLEQDASGPGKFGDQLAGELFFSNMETPFWGWADSRSTFLLDFWAAFDPRIVFILTCCSLDHHLARLMETQDAASLNLDDLITSWQQFHTHLLQFYHTYPDRCLLVDIHDCAMQFNTLNQTCRDKWHLPLTDIPESESESESYPFPAPLARHIAAGFTKNHPEAASLWNEIQATVSRSTSDPVQADGISFNHIAQNYQTTKDRSAELRQISDLEKQIATLQKQAQDSAGQIEQHKKNAARKDSAFKQVEQQFQEKSTQFQELEKQITTLKKEQAQKDTQFKELEQRNQEATEENDLILQQLHQVQEELESIFLKKQEAERQWAEKQKKLQTDLKDKEQQLKQREEQIATLQKQSQESAAQLAQEKKIAAQKDIQLKEREKQIATLQKQAQDSAGQIEQHKKNAARKDTEFNQIKQQLVQKSTQLQEHEKQLATLKKEQMQKDIQLKEREKQIATLQKQAQDSAGQIEQHKKNAARKDTEFNQVKQQLVQKSTQLQEHEKQIATLEKEQMQKDTRTKELEQKNQEVSEENDLILLQLHQVQEELESIFLKKQEQKTLLEKAEARWARLLKRMPDYCDYGDIRIIQGDDASSLICEVRDLDAGAQTYPELEFETFIIKGVTGFRFKHTEYITQEDLIPVAQTPEEAKVRSSVLKNLTTTEWLLLESTAHFLKTCLKTEKFDKETLPAPLIQETLNGLERFNQVISKFPEILRYDAVSFNEKVLSEDCEHLEIRLENLSCRDLACPEFVFRLTCAGLSSSDFGSNPRLEFPEDTSTIFKTWFDCSSNPDDPRFELRFAPPEALDLDVWNNLSKDDAGFIQILTAHLPEMIEKSGSQSGHDESKWLAVAKDVGEILTRWANRL
jgi:hypothetical protein